MEVQVRLFAAAKEIVGADRILLELPAGSTVATLRKRLVEACPRLAEVAACSLFALNAAYAAETAVVAPDAEAALIPPVSGG